MADSLTGSANRSFPFVQVPVGLGPEDVVYDCANGYVYVANSDSSNVSVINGTHVVGSVNVGLTPVAEVVDSENGEVFVLNLASASASVIRGTSVVDTVSVGPGGGQGPSSATFDPQDGDVYVTGTYGVLSVLNQTSVVGTMDFRLPLGQPTFDPDDGYVYVPVETSSGPGYEVVMNDTTEVATIPVGPGAGGAAFDSANGDLYLPNYASGNVSVIHGTAVVASVTVGSWPDQATFDGGNGYVYIGKEGPGNVSVLDGTALLGSVVVAASEPAGSTGLSHGTYDNVTGFVYEVRGSSGNVSVINGTTLAGTVNLGHPPIDEVAVDSQNGYVYVTNSYSNVAVIGASPPASSSSGLVFGIPMSDAYLILAVVIVAVVLCVAGFAWRKRWSRTPPDSKSTPPPPR